jgi:hypothetical protein
MSKKSYSRREFVKQNSLALGAVAAMGVTPGLISDIVSGQTFPQ